MEKSKGNPSSQLVGGAIRQELDRLWAEIRRVQPIAGAGQRARYTTAGVIIETPCCGGEGEASAPVPTGACCDGVECELTTEAACLSPKSWLAAGTCAPNNCVTPIMSCCVADGSCTLKTFSECAATEGAWGQSDTCTPNPCIQPPPTGSCCAADGTCSVTTSANCSGTWTSGGTCSPNICTQPPPTGSCCNSAVWQCTTTTAAACAYTWTEAGNCGNCAPPPPPATGACCSAGVCSETTQTGCTNIGGVFQGAGIFCSPNPCGAPPPTGRCCHGDGSCSVTTAAACVGVLDVWAAGEDCTTSAAMCFGACCLPQGCMIFDAAGCAGMGGSFNGNGTTCQPDPCVAPPATGACCATDGTCSMTTQAACLAVAGSAWSLGAVCSPNPCATPPPTGACCAGGSCGEAMTAAACAAVAGVFHVGLTCAAAPCAPPTGSCCAPFTNACSVSTQSTCAIISGTWTSGGVCQPDPCVPTPPPPVTGRCCAADGTCSMTTQAACSGIAWLENFTCATPCPQPPTGSCCVSGGTCFDALAPGSAGTAIGGGVCEANQNYIAGVFCAARSCLGGCCWFHPSLGNICAVQGATPINNEFDCNFSSGTTFYTGGDCFSCTQHFTAEYPGGACCDLLGGCTLTRFADCVGLWLPDDVCWQDGCPSPSTGACCRMLNGLPDCHLDTAANCDATGGQFTPNTVCADVLCPPQREIVGACCDAAGLCFDGATIQTCASTSTFYAGLNCFDAMCVPFTG